MYVIRNKCERELYNLKLKINPYMLADRMSKKTADATCLTETVESGKLRKKLTEDDGHGEKLGGKLGELAKEGYSEVVLAEVLGDEYRSRCEENEPMIGIFGGLEMMTEALTMSFEAGVGLEDEGSEETSSTTEDESSE